MKSRRPRKTEALVMPVKEEKPLDTPAPKPEPKKIFGPVLQIEEVARGFRQYRPHHLQAIVSFCNARGFPTHGTKEELLVILSHFGW